MPDSHYVLVIHGTWNAPAGGTTKWHQLDNDNPTNFCRQLNERFNELGLGLPIGRKLDDCDTYFSWSGANNHDDRMAAGDDLFQRILTIASKDPAARIHLISHSHGCNVILRAVQRYCRAVEDEAQLIIDKAISAYRGEVTADAAIHSALQSVFGDRADFVMSQRSSSLTELRVALEKARERAERPARTGIKAIDEVLGRLRKGWRAAVPELQNRRDPDTVRVHPKTSKFREAWRGSASGHRLGRSVFLGPVFLHKNWARRSFYSWRFILSQFTDVIAMLLAGILLGYLAVILIWGVTWLYALVFGGIPFHVNPADWPRWLKITSGIYMALFAVTFFFAAQGWRRHDRNLYFDPTAVEARTQPADRIEALIVSAGALDEALLGLAAEPLVYGLLLPQIRAITSPTLRWRIPRRVAGAPDAPHVWIFRVIIFPLVNFVRQLLVRPLTWTLSERRLTRQVVQLVSTPAFGVPPDEFRNARITASSSLDLPKLFHVYAWDVSQQLVHSPPVHTHAQTQGRLSFLWDRDALELRYQKSPLWSAILKELTEIHSSYSLHPAETRDEMSQRLALICVTLEERFKELIGVINLSHSSYYSNESIRERIANFIATGILPEAQAPDVAREGEANGPAS